MVEPLDIPVMYGDDVILRPHMSDDLVPVLERCVDPESVRWTVIPTPYTEEMARQYLTATKQPMADHVSWAIEQGGLYAGTIDLRVAEGAGTRAWGDIGFVMHPRARGRGALTEAVRLALEHAFGALSWELVVWEAQIGNIGSYKPMWRNGFPPPVAVPALLNQRGEPRDGWHSVLEADMPRTPATEWDEVHDGLLRDIEAARRPT